MKYRQQDVYYYLIYYNFTLFSVRRCGSKANGWHLVRRSDETCVFVCVSLLLLHRRTMDRRYVWLVWTEFGFQQNLRGPDHIKTVSEYYTHRHCTMQDITCCLSRATTCDESKLNPIWILFLPLVSSVSDWTLETLHRSDITSSVHRWRDTLISPIWFDGPPRDSSLPQ